MHFIPSHQQQMPSTIHDSAIEEKLFHNKEEVALHQENQKVKDELGKNINKKTVFHNKGGA
jgi:hypothetical protein